MTTRYPGASAKTVIDTVALPIEQQVNGVEDMLYMQSYSGADGTYSLTVTFKIGTDLNFAQVLVQNRVSSALSQLPQSVQNQGVTVQKRSTAILLFVTLTSPNATYDSLFLCNYATINIRDELSRLPGRRQRHRVRRRPVFDAGLARPEQAAGALADAAGRDLRDPAAEPAGDRGPGRHAADACRTGVPVHAERQRAGSTTRTSSRTSSSRPATMATSPACATSAGSNSAPRPTARCSRSTTSRPTGIGVFQSPGANALEVEQAVEKKMAVLAKAFPQDIKYDTPFDTTKFVSESIKEVYKTLIEAGLLVLVVILIFLQDWRAMLVPATTRAGHDHRRLRRDGGARLHRQYLDPVCDRARDRHRGGRRHRRGRGRRAQYRAGHVRP